MTSARDDPNFLSVALEPKLGASADASEALRGAFRELPDRVTADLLTVVTELVTNAVEHGPGLPIGLRVSRDPKTGVIKGRVVDQGDPSKSIPRIREVTQNQGGGFGLRLVDAVTTKWTVTEGSTSVEFEISLDGREP